MTLWIDAQISPAMARWISATFAVQAVAVRDIGLRDATDHEIFMLILGRTLSQALALLQAEEKLIEISGN